MKRRSDQALLDAIDERLEARKQLAAEEEKEQSLIRLLLLFFQPIIID